MKTKTLLKKIEMEIMKRYCKDVDITDFDLIEKSIRNCLKTKMKRNDTKCLLKLYDDDINKLVRALQKEIMNKELKIKPIWYTQKIDKSNHKLRTIGIQDIKHQLYDYIAVEALKPMFVRIGEYQCAAISGKGQIYGLKAIKRWLRNGQVKYALKADISKCYESIPKDQLLKFIKVKVKNDDVVWLLDELLQTYEMGLSIGSYLSQFLCNLYLSQLYHYISEDCYKTRNKRNGQSVRVNLSKHVLFYMDDILVLGTNAKDLNKLMKLIIQKSSEMGLTIKDDWRVFKIADNKESKGSFIDMLGFRIYREYTTIRRRVFLRLRRSFNLHNKCIDIKRARKCVSYWGFIKATDSYKLNRKYKMERTFAKSKKVISYESKIRIKTGDIQVH